MQCNHCKYHTSRVVYTRHHDLQDLIQRRRECVRCGRRFTTHEKIKENKLKQKDTYRQAS